MLALLALLACGPPSASPRVVAPSPRAAPRIRRVSALPADATVSDTLHCRAYDVQDPDGDPVRVSYRWEVDGQPSPVTGKQLGSMARGTQVRCFATPSDGVLVGAEVASRVVTVLDAPPVASGLALTPAALIPGDHPRCSYVFTDADGDPDASTVTWEVNGAAAGTGATLATPLVAGDVVTCTVAPFDGIAAGTPASLQVTVGASPAGGNVLVYLIDDVGVDVLQRYNVGQVFPQTPNIDALIDDGVMFTRAYGDPVCSPTRATLQTGRFGYHTGVTLALSAAGFSSLGVAETTLPEMLDQRTGGAYDSSYLGKWHLSSKKPGPYLDAPLVHGYGWWAGMMTGFDANSTTDGLPQGYYDWEKVTNGIPARTTTYATADTVDDAVTRVGAMTEPWLLFVAPIGAHAPVAWPPADLWSGVPAGATVDEQKYHAMVEAVDTELGRLLAALTPEQRADTTIIVLADNGTYEPVNSPPIPAGYIKDSPYELGSRVPLVISGPWVGAPGTVSDAFVQTVDLFPTIAELAGVPYDAAELATIDGISVVPWLRDPGAPTVRETVMNEEVGPLGLGPYHSGEHAIRDDRWRLIERYPATVELYDMQGVSWEGADLMLLGPLTAEQQAAYDRLFAALPYHL